MEKQRLKEEEDRERKDIEEVNNDKILFNNEDDDEEKEKRTPPQEGNNRHLVQQPQDNNKGVLQDDLPTEFDEAFLPTASKKLLEEKIGVKALDDYFKSRPHIKLERDAAVKYILGQANIAYRNNSIYSVVIKPKDKIPPSGDIHDYTSLARYFWKNPNTPSGLPYIRIDGKPNPDMDLVWDYRLLRKVFRDCYYMGQAYFWTGEERYAEKVVFRVKQWFLDEETYMNPNIKYGSLIFGNNLGRAQGVLDMFKVYGMFDALKAIEGSKAMHSEPTLIPRLQTWFKSYISWLDESFEANQEKNAKNNHGTYFSVQYVSILEFLGRNEDARALMEEAKEKRVGPQIRKDGAQPHETFRPISFFYSTFNLQGLMLLAIQASTYDVDLWHHRGPVIQSTIRITSKKSVTIESGGGTIEDAIRYLSEYAVRDPSEWPYFDSGTRNLKDVLKMAKMASVVYGQNHWQVPIENLEAKIDEEIPGEGTGGEGAGAGSGNTHSTTVDEGDPNSFICELGILSKGRLWHCYK
ncbi:alginate lyase-domain-containing protein [Lobosporangium transversale]|uniref:Alginate lyase-domain-containing protein n=1 Tax=Lobosporangium transversale TaxID=64571 RepID=A0A1Y2H367_9FUNG|nr:alginate lyase-domain-containing protein [Lobosporangium transversale]ORZ28999.1 alginate lyase-domain-containing protein [Lobosporangium transversale]|eukprot:XP_021886672.1 alginate lyase-domain-containing protein [Lobosporangium transversale]